MPTRSAPPALRRRHAGAALIEFAIAAPLITLIGMALLHYGHFFFTKNHMNHAVFMAARAGSTGNADLARIRVAYARAMIPAYGGGTNAPELAATYADATADTGVHARIELLNPTKESFDDWNDPDLQKELGVGRRVIPNRGLAFRDPADIGASSGQNVQDANLIKIRVTHGYRPLSTLAFISRLHAVYLKWLDPGDDAFYTAEVGAGRIPIVSHATVLMQSDAIEPGNPVSTPGPGNEGIPVDPGPPPVTTDPPPECGTAGCSVPSGPGPLDPGGGAPCTGGYCPPCVPVP